MKLSLSASDLLSYTQRQLSHFFPDGHTADLRQEATSLDLALDRVRHCFERISLHRYCESGEARLNHLYSDHYLMYLWFLSNTLWKAGADPQLVSKLYYLNKALHAFDCVYDTPMPDIFLVFHGSGAVLGKAKYSDYFVAFQGTTIGAHAGKYPRLGRGVSLAAHSSIIGDCEIGNRVSIGSQAGVFKKDIADDHLVYRAEDGRLLVSARERCHAQLFFVDDLREDPFAGPASAG